MDTLITWITGLGAFGAVVAVALAGIYAYFVADAKKQHPGPPDPDGEVHVLPYEPGPASRGASSDTLIWPLPEPVRITQAWGSWPDYYRRFSYSGVPLQGHNGIDLAAAIGTPIQAIDAGEVMGLGFEEGGFGWWIKVRHAWGESIYAHLNEIHTNQGHRIQQGEVIGKTGNSGGSTGPHLHLGIRVAPYNRADGWGGCTDPLPLLPAGSVYASRGDSVDPSPLAESEEDRP